MCDEKKKILRNLEKTGFPTEIKATKILSLKGEIDLSKPYWTVVNQQSYYDDSEGKIRTIDILAERLPSISQRMKREEYKVCRLYIECKKSDKEKWIFYVRASGPYYLMPGIIETRRTNEDRKYLKDTYNPFDFIPVSYKASNPYIGLSYQIAFRGKDTFYEAQMQALKSLFYSERTIPAPNFFFIPIVLFDGEMYKYDISGEEEILERISYLRYVSQGIPESPVPVYVDVVDINAFSKYLKIIEDEFDML